MFERHGRVEFLAIDNEIVKTNFGHRSGDRVEYEFRILHGNNINGGNLER